MFVYAVISPPTSFLLLRLMGAIYALLIYDFILRMAGKIEFLSEKGRATKELQLDYLSSLSRPDITLA